MLGRQHHGIDTMRLAIDIAHGHLALGIRPQERQTAILAQLGLTLHQTVCIVDRRRHQLWGFITGVTEHQALVTGAGIQIIVGRVIHTLGDVVGLLVIADHDGAALVVNPVLGIVIADTLDRIARHLDVIHMRIGGNFTGQNNQTGVAQRLRSYAREGVLGEDGIQDCIRNLVSNLIGMAFRNRFGSKEEIICHIWLSIKQNPGRSSARSTPGFE